MKWALWGWGAACEAGFVGEGCIGRPRATRGGARASLCPGGDSAGLSRRVGHAAVYHQDSDSLWIFGGQFTIIIFLLCFYACVCFGLCV